MDSNVWFVIGIGGVTNSGKTTLANSLHQFLNEPANSKAFGAHTRIGTVKMLNQDLYFLPIDHENHQLIEKLGHNNWEIITAMDMKRMCTDILQILGDKFTLYSTKQYRNAMDCSENSFKERYSAQTQQQNHLHSELVINFLILEGFLLFNNSFTLDVCNVKLHLHLPYERCYERRLKRNYDPPDVPGYFEMIVWPHYEKHFKEFSNRNDIVFLNADIKQDKIFTFLIDFLKSSL